MERDRLAFVEKRDGKEAMIKFAEQTLATYVMESAMRGPYKESIEEYIKVLEENGKSVNAEICEPEEKDGDE